MPNAPFTNYHLTPLIPSSMLLPMKRQAAALAHPNIAFIKYWGLKDEERKIPTNDSLSMNIGCLSTQTTVSFDPELTSDTLVLNETTITGKGLARVQLFLDRVRQMAGERIYARVVSENNFPIGAGIASSASAFAALALASTRAIGPTTTTSRTRATTRERLPNCWTLPVGKWAQTESVKRAVSSWPFLSRLRPARKRVSRPKSSCRRI